MKLLPHHYQGRPSSPRPRGRLLLADELLDRPPGDPGTVFTCYMCAYAREVLLPSLPGPYT